MKLRLPHKFQAALMAALASVSFTTLSSGTLAVATGAALLAGQQAQAADEDSTTFTTTNTGGKSNSNFSAYGYIITLNGARLATTPSDVPITTYNEVNLVSVTGNLRYQTGTSGVNTGLALTDSTGKILALSTDSTNTNNAAFTWHFDEGTTVSTDSPLYFLFYKTNNANIEVGYTFKSGDAWQAGAGTGGVYTYSNSADMTSCTFVSSGVGGTLTPPTASNQLVHAPYISIVTTGTVAADEYTWSATDTPAYWDVATSNWTFKGAPGTYKSGTDNIVNFNDGAYAKEVTVVGAIEAGTVHVNANYEFTVGSEASLSARTLDVASGATATVGGAGALSIGNVTVASGATATVGGAGALSIGNVTGAGSFVVGSGTLTLANLSLGTGSTLGLGENAHVTITSKPTLSGLNVTLATGSVLDLSGNSSDASDIRNIMGNVSGAGTVKIDASSERVFAANQSDTLLTNLEFISSAEFNGTGWQDARGHTFNVGNGTVAGGIKVADNLRLESQTHINVKKGSSLTVGGNLIMGHGTAGNPGHVDVDHGTLSVGHIQFQDNTTLNTITLADSTVEATQAGNLFASTGTSSTVSATNVTLKATDVDWAWNRAIDFGGTLAVDAGTHTITLGAAGADFSVVNPITLTSGTVAFAGNWNLSGITHTGTTQYTGGATEGDVNGFASLVTSIQLVNMGASTHIGSTSGAHFTIDGVTATLDENGLAKTSGQVDYATFHVMTGSENVSQGRKDSHDPVYSLANETTLVVDADLTGAKLTREGGSTGNATLEIKSGNTYTSDGIVKHVTITGAGTYALKSGTTAMVDSLASEWTGAVRISGSANNLDLSSGTHLYNDHSSVILDGYTGYFKQASQTIAADVEIGAGGITLINGWGASVITFTGALTGSGNINRNNNADVSPDLRFTGDVSGYTGSVVNSRNGGWGLRLTYSGSANQIKATEIKNATDATGTITIDLQAADTVVDSVISRGSGTININVGTSQAPITATFNKEVSASALTINSNSSATFKETLTLSGSLTLDGSATLEKGGSIGGSIDLSHSGAAHGTLTLAAWQNLTYGSSFWGANNNKLLLGAGATVQKASGAPVTIEGLAVAEGEESYVSSSSNEQLLLDKSAFTLHNVKATINTASDDVQLRFDNSKFVTSHTVTLKNLQSVFSGMDIQGGTTTVGASDLTESATVTLGEVTLSGGNLTLADHVTGTVNGMNVTASGTVTGGTLKMDENAVITMGASGALTLTGVTVDLSAKELQDGASGYKDGQNGGNGFAYTSGKVQLVNFAEGSAVTEGENVQYVHGVNHGRLLQDGDDKGYVTFDDTNYSAFFVNVAGQTEDLSYAINTAASHEETVLESVYLNAGTLNADVATKVASLHINETADKASGNVSLTGTAANFGTVSGKGTLNVDSATTLTADTLSIAAGETLTLTGSEHISFGAITSHGTLDIGADTLVTATGDITVNAGESLTTTGAGKLTGTSLTVYGDASLGADAEFSGDLNPNSGSLTIGGHTIVRGTMHGGDLVEGKEYKSAAILVESTGVLDVNNISANWGFSSFTVNGALNVTNELKLTTGNATYTVDGSGTITTKKLTLNNEGKYVFDGTNGLTLVVGEGGISAGSGGRTLTLANGLTVKASDDWTMNQDAKLNGTVNLNTQGNDLTISSVLSNAANTTGGLAISGGGTVVLNGGNSFSGGLTVTGATVEMGNNNALGNANNAITIGQGGVIDLKGHDNVTYAYTLAGGTLQNTGNATGAGMKQTMGLTLTENSTIGGTGDFQIIASGHAATTINLGSNTLAKTGDNTVHFVNSTITEGTVQVDAGALDFRTDQGSNTVRADIVLNGGGTALTGGFKYADSTEAVIRNLTAKQDVTVDAAIEIGNNVTMATSVDNGKTLTMTGAITGTGNFSLSGTGTLALGSSINTTGDVTVAAGAAITFANGASITANSFGLGTGSKLDFSDYKGAIGSEIHVVTTASGVTGYTGAVITGPTAPRGMTATVAQEENDIVLTFQAKEDATMHLYILTGQSNSLGAVKGKPMSAEMIAAYQSEALLWNGNMHKNRPSGADTNRYIADPTWQVVAPQEPGLTLDASAYSGNPCMGPEYGFSYIMQNKGWTELLGADDTLAVVKGSLDGGGNGYWLQDNNAYQTLLDNVKLSIQDAVTMGYKNIQLEGLMYLQGESNSAAETAVADTRFADFLSYLTVDLNTWLATEEAPEGVTVTFADNAVTGENFSNATTSQKFLDAATKDGKVNADDNGRGFVFTKDLANIGDDLHYRGTSQLTIGARYAYAFAVQKGINVGAVRGQDYSKTLDQAGAWWMEKLPGENEVATWDISSVSTVNEIAAGKTLTVGGIEIQEVYYDEATAKGQGSVAINGGTISLGQHGINLVGGDLAITSAVSARATQTWQAANGHKLVVNGTTIGDGATLKLADDLYLTFGYITGTGSLEIGTVTFDMDLDYMGTMGKASYISSEGEGANGYVNEVNLIDLSAGDGTISFTHGGGVENITQAGDLAGCTLTLGGDSKTLKVTMPSTAPDTVYFTRSGEVTYTSTDAGENGIYNATELVLSGQQGSPATLTLQSNLQDGVGIKAVGLGGTVKIDSNVVLNASSLETDGAPVTIAGSGVLVGRSSGSVDSLAPADVFGPGVTLSTDWTGTVKIADSTIPGGNIGIKLNELGNENSVVEFENVKAFLNTSSYTYTPNIKFTGAGLNLDAGASGQTFTFSGDVTGDGTFHPSFSRGSDNQTFVFAGDVEGWNGQVLVDTNKTVTVKFSDEADTVNAAIKRTGGTLNLYASTDTTFNGAISGLSSFVVDANKSASVLGGIGTNATTLNAGSSLTIGGTGTTNTLGTVTVGGANANLTFGADVTSVAVSNLTLNDNASLTLTNNKAGATLGLVTLNSATLTVQGSEAATATRMTVGDQKAPTLVLGQNLSVGQLDTMGALNTFTIKSAEGGEAKTLTAGTLDLANQETKIALQNVTLTVTGAATVGEVVERTTNNDTMLVGSGATLNLNGGVNWNHNGKYVDLVIENGGAVNVTNGTENTLRGVNLGAGSSLTFGTGTSTTIGGAVVLANTITNDGSVTLTGTVNLDALTALHENEGYWEGEEDTGNGFYYNSSTVRVFAEDHVGEVVSTGATITYKGVGGTLDDATGIFEANGEKDLTTFHAMKDGSWSSLGNAITKGETHLTTMKMHAGTGLTADVTTAVENLSIDADSATKAAHVAGGTANFTNLIGEGKVDVDSEAVLNATNITVESGKSLAIGGAGALGITNINGAGTVNVDAATVTGGNVAINGGGTVNFGDGETISFTGLNVSGNGTNVTFDSLVTVTGNVRTSIGFENPATEGTTVTFNAGYVYTGNNGYALLAGNNDTIKLGGTTNLSNKTVGLNATGKLVVLEDAVVAVGRMYNTSAGTSNGTVEVQQRGTLTIGSVGVSTITNLSNAGKVTVNRTTTVASAFSNTGSISVVGASASSMTTLNVNNGDATLDMGAISLNNAELHIGSGAESRVRNISTLTVDGAGRLTQNSWNNLMHITALNNGTGEGERSFTWQMNTNHYTNSVLYLDGEGNFNGTFTASRGNGSGNGAYQGHLQVNHQKALQNAVLEVNGYNASNYMSVALNADKVETRGVTGNANSIIYAGEADTSVNKGAGRTAPVSTREGGATLAMNVADETTHEFAGKVESGISLEKSGAGTQVFSGDMSNFNGSVDVQAGELNIMNIAQDTSLNVKDVTIAAGATMGVYNGATATPETASEGTLTMKAGNTLKAGGNNATLNANLVMEAGSVLEVSLAQATHGLTMGSTVELNMGDLLGTEDLGFVQNLKFGEYYYLYNDVESLSVNGTQYDSLNFKDWTDFDMDASTVYTQLDEKRYALVYSWNGENVGRVAITLLPEPTTGTLSLLALCALAARRRRK